MRTKSSLLSAMAAIGVALVVGLAPMPLSAQQKAAPAVRIGDNDLGGVVRSATGPEAGVWVIAETTGLPTPFAKIVVTDDQGRYVIPDLPRANYDVELRCLGARLRAHRLAEDRDETGEDRRFDGRAGAECGGRCAVLSGDLLVCDAQHPGSEPVFRPEAR
jgi:hypothetical protein